MPARQPPRRACGRQGSDPPDLTLSHSQRMEADNDGGDIGAAYIEPTNVRHQWTTAEKRILCEALVHWEKFGGGGAKKDHLEKEFNMRCSTIQRTGTQLIAYIGQITKRSEYETLREAATIIINRENELIINEDRNDNNEAGSNTDENDVIDDEEDDDYIDDNDVDEANNPDVDETINIISMEDNTFEQEIEHLMEESERIQVVRGRPKAPPDPRLIEDRALIEKFDYKLTEIKNIDVEDRGKIPDLRGRENDAKLLAKIIENKVIEACGEKPTIKTINDAIYAAATVIVEAIRGKINSGNTNRGKRRKLPAKRRLESKVKEIRRDLGRVTAYLERFENVPTRLKLVTREIRKKYGSTRSALMNAKGRLIIQLRSTAAKLHAWNNKEKRRELERLVKTDQRQLHRDLASDNDVEFQPDYSNVPSDGEIINFWKSIWDHKNTKEYSTETWYQDYISDLNRKRINTLTDINITGEVVKSAFMEMGSWKAAGPDKIKVFWYKILPGVYGKIAEVFSDVVTMKVKAPDWFYTGITHLIGKPISEGTKRRACDYRPISCLCCLYKALTKIIANKLMSHLEKYNILSMNQLGCRAGKRGCTHQLLLDHALMHHARNSLHRVSCAWLDFQKAFDSLAHSWILKWLTNFGIGPMLVNFIGHCMENWALQMSIDGRPLDNGVVKVNRGIFQGDTLSPCLFILSVQPISYALQRVDAGYRCGGRIQPTYKLEHLLFVDDLKLYAENPKKLSKLVKVACNVGEASGLEFGMPKCAWIDIVRGFPIENKPTDTPDELIDMKYLETGERYKYLGIPQHMLPDAQLAFNNTRKILLGRIAKVLSVKLSASNVIKTINSWCISVVYYPLQVGLIKRTQAKQLDTEIRNLFRQFHGHGYTTSTDILYLSRDKGGRGLVNIEDAWCKFSFAIGEYASKNLINLIPHLDNKNPLYKLVNTSDNIKESLNLITNNEHLSCDSNIHDILNKCLEQKRITHFYSMSVAADWFRKISKEQCNGLDVKATLGWMKNSAIPLQVEADVISLRTLSIPTRAFPIEQSDPLCRLCGTAKETLFHIVSNCPVLAHAEYFDRHNRICKLVYKTCCDLISVPFENHWWVCRPPCISVTQGDLFWDQPINTPHKLEFYRPDILAVLHSRKLVLIIEISVCADYSVVKKEGEKRNKYQALVQELALMYRGYNIKLIPVVIGVTGAVTCSLPRILEDGLLGCLNIQTCQRVASTSTIHLLRRVLGGPKVAI